MQQAAADSFHLAYRVTAHPGFGDSHIESASTEVTCEMLQRVIQTDIYPLKELKGGRNAPKLNPKGKGTG